MSLSHTSGEQSSFNLYGYLSSRLGLGEAARITARVLALRGERFFSADIGPVVDVTHDSLEAQWNAVDKTAQLTGEINLFHLNPPELLEVLARVPGAASGLTSCVNALIPFWELPSLPEDWVPVCSAMDVILAPTRFVGDAVRRSCPEARIIQFPQAVYPPRSVAIDRRRWGIDGGAVAFLVAFDVLSDVQRKNPWGALDAFRQAFDGRSDVRMVVKAGNAESAQADRAQLARLRDVARDDSRVLLIDDSLSRADLWSLYASVDVYVSLHRSEGLGLGMLEAMSVGTPVVATGWSGNVDFMTGDDSVLVPFDLVPVSGTSIVAYDGQTVGQLWAEPRQLDAVAALQRLANDRSALAELGLRAREAAERVRERQLSGTAFDELGEMRAAVLASGEHSQRANGLGAAAAALRRRRWAVAQLRHLGLKASAPVGEVERALTLLDDAARDRLIKRP